MISATWGFDLKVDVSLETNVFAHCFSMYIQLYINGLCPYRGLEAQRSCKIGPVVRYAKMKCNKRFIKVDSPNSQFILKLSASSYYLLSVNICSEMFFFFEERHSCSNSFHNI